MNLPAAETTGRLEAAIASAKMRRSWWALSMVDCNAGWANMSDALERRTQGDQDGCGQLGKWYEEEWCTM